MVNLPWNFPWNLEEPSGAIQDIGKTPPPDPALFPPNYIRPPDYRDPQQLCNFVDNLIEDLLRVEDPMTHVIALPETLKMLLNFFAVTSSRSSAPPDADFIVHWLGLGSPRPWNASPLLGCSI